MPLITFDCKKIICLFIFYFRYIILLNPIASMVIKHLFKSDKLSKSGMAVISLLMDSVRPPSTTPFSVENSHVSFSCSFIVGASYSLSVYSNNLTICYFMAPLHPFNKHFFKRYTINITHNMRNSIVGRKTIIEITICL